MGFVGVVLNIALAVFFVMMTWRFVTSVEKISDAFERYVDRGQNRPPA